MQETNEQKSEFWDEEFNVSVGSTPAVEVEQGTLVLNSTITEHFACSENSKK